MRTGSKKGLLHLRQSFVIQWGIEEMFIIISLIVLAATIGMILTVRWFMLIKASGAFTGEAEGTVLKVISRKYKDQETGENKTSYTLTVQYEVNGKEYKRQMPALSGELIPQEGQSIMVEYYERSPKFAVVKGFEHPENAMSEYLIAALILWVMIVVIFIIRIPAMLSFTAEGKELYTNVCKGIICIASICIAIAYPHTKEYKRLKETNPKTVRGTIATFILIAAKMGFDVIFDIIVDHI